MKEIRFEFERDCSTDGPHLHDAMEVLYVLTSRIGIMHGETNHMLRAEQFLVLNPFEHHEISCTAGTGSGRRTQRSHEDRIKKTKRRRMSAVRSSAFLFTSGLPACSDIRIEA